MAEPLVALLLSKKAKSMVISFALMKIAPPKTAVFPVKLAFSMC